jgi:hypothetical protein
MFGARVQRPRDRAIGGRFAPAELAYQSIDLCEEGRLLAQIDRRVEKLDPLAF